MNILRKEKIIILYSLSSVYTQGLLYLNRKGKDAFWFHV